MFFIGNTINYFEPSFKGRTRNAFFPPPTEVGQFYLQKILYQESFQRYKNVKSGSNKKC